jgi:hypothetical protein
MPFYRGTLLKKGVLTVLYTCLFFYLRIMKLAQEFRVGNLFIRSRIVDLHPTGAKVLNRDNSRQLIAYDELKQISLNEEMLLGEFDFTDGVHYGQTVYHREGIVLVKHSDSGWLYLHFQKTPIYFVHQLQNLYHSLTGKELPEVEESETDSIFFD